MQDSLIDDTVRFVKSTLINAEAGHDWWHINRVWLLSKKIAKKEHADLLVVELAALLHDIADSKFHNGNEDIGPGMAANFLKVKNLSNQQKDHIVNIIRHISFKNQFTDDHFESNELKIVQDADRLDAIGAIGIARAFNYGGYKNRIFYDPEFPPQIYDTKEAYQKSDSPTINHFYEKLLLLKDLMHTETAKKIAIERHEFMLQYLEHFYKEWNVETDI